MWLPKEKHARWTVLQMQRPCCVQEERRKEKVVGGGLQIRLVGCSEDLTFNKMRTMRGCEQRSRDLT